MPRSTAYASLTNVHAVLEVVFYAVIAIIAGLAALGRHFERRENTRARLLTSDGDPAWANTHELSSSAGSHEWSRRTTRHE